MKITITKSAAEFDAWAGWRIIRQMVEKPDAVIGLSTGETTGGMHSVASEIHARFPFDVSKVTLFGVDEMAKVPEDFPGTCAARLMTEIVEPFGIPGENFIMPKTRPDDFDEECRRFEAELMRRGGIDLQILGVGMDGHLGMNLPGTPFSTETWLTKLSGELETRIRAKNSYPEPNPLEGITLGIKTIMNIRRIVLAAKGTHKAEIIRQAVCGPVTPDVPASVLQLHPDCEFLLDPEAGALVKEYAAE